MKLESDDLRQITHIEFRNAEKLRGKIITGVSTDSRRIQENELFVALRGETYDGHKFIADAFAKGCCAAVVDTSSNIETVKTMPLLIVENTTQALGDLARHYRLKFNIPVIAIGGSNGKTTTKDLVSRVLDRKYRVMSTQGNLNNHIGVPQTLFALEKRHQVAVVELGTNHPGELRHLCDIVQPTHGVVTNIGREHLEFFKTLAGVATEESQIYEFLRSRKGSVAFVNADDRFIIAKAKKVKAKVTYGFTTRKSSVFGQIVELDERGCAKMKFTAKSAQKGTSVQLPIPGVHNATNALCAAAIGLSFKVPASQIKSALESAKPAHKRMEFMQINGITLYNDTYNANPDSMMAALRTLADARVPGKKIAVLADMKELGEKSPEEHRHIGKELSSLAIDYVLTFGDLAKEIHDAAGIRFKFHYDQKNVLAEFLAELASSGDAILVKGSRGMKMEDIVIFLQERLTKPLPVA